jgi:tripartite-type tricarboxylate transporter receptor subunit TctC
MKFLKHAAAIAALCASMIANASSEITLTMASGPGGNLNRYGIQLQTLLSRWLEQPVVLEFKPGAQGQIAAQHVAKTTATAPHFLLGLLSYDPKMDQTTEIVPVIGLGESAILMFTHPTGPRSMQEILRSGNKDYSVGVANSPLTFYSDGLIKAVSGRANFTKVPYNAFPQQLSDILGKHLDIGISVPANIKSHLDAGTIRPLAVFNSRRLNNLPDTPTIKELGVSFPQENMQIHLMLWASRSTSPEVVEKVRKEWKTWLQTSEGIQSLRSMDIVLPLEPTATNPIATIKSLVPLK